MTENQTARTENFSGTIETAYGNKLATELKYEGSYEHLLTVDAIPADEVLQPKDILATVNNKRKAAARQAAMQKALDGAGIKKPTLDDPAVQLSEMVKILRKAQPNVPEEALVQMAKSVLQQ
jgi:hypothetical protein